MTDVDGPRLATADEFADVTELVDRVFGRERGGMAARRPFTYDSNAPEHHAVIVKDGDVVSHAAAVPETLAVGGGEIQCWGIAGVATDPRERGNGYMSDVLEFLTDRMDGVGVPLSELAGDRQRYNHFGWEVAGRIVDYELSTRSVSPEPVAEGRVTTYDGDEEQVAAISRIHGEERFRVVRDREQTRTVHGKRGLVTHLYRRGGDATAYLSLSRGRGHRHVEELGGSERGLRALVSHVYRVYGLGDVSVHLPPSHPRAPLFERLSYTWRLQPHRMLNVRDLPAVLSAFEPQLRDRWRRAGTGERGAVVLAVAGDGDPVRLAFGPDGVSVEPTDDDPDLELDRTAVTGLLFGFHDRHRETRRRFPGLDTLLPLDFYVWHSERV